MLSTLQRLEQASYNPAFLLHLATYDCTAAECWDVVRLYKAWLAAKHLGFDVSITWTCTNPTKLTWPQVWMREAHLANCRICMLIDIQVSTWTWTLMLSEWPDSDEWSSGHNSHFPNSYGISRNLRIPVSRHLRRSEKSRLDQTG